MAAPAPSLKASAAAPQDGFSVLGTRIDAVQIPDAIRRMEEWISRREFCHYIAVTGMHGVTEALHDPGFKQILNSSDLVVPDGFPLVWLGRRKGFSHLKRRVYGPELMATFCEQTATKGYRHFLYGGAAGVAEQLASHLRDKYPGLQIAATYYPPFRPLTPAEDEAAIQAIRNSHSDIVWVGLSTPKQERWMFEHRERLNVPILVGVGAAFDFHTGRLNQAPVWMQENGLEWCFRLFQEPRRLWRRYLLGGSEFVLNVALQELGLRKFD